MIKHYIKIAIRNLSRQKALSIINIAGLTIGLACFSLFLLYAINEFSYDRFHKNAANIYRLYDWWDFKGEKPRQGNERSSITPLGPAMKQDFPEVENYVRLKESSTPFVRIADKTQTARLTFADPQILSVFSFPLLYGNKATALNDPHNIILTKEKALQFFGEVNAIGRHLDIKNDKEYESFIVTGIANNIPANSSIRFDMLGSFEKILQTNYGKESMNNWHMTIGIEVFVQLRKGSSLAKDQARMASFYSKYNNDDGEMLIKNGLWDGKGARPNGWGLQPLLEMHTDTKIDQGAVSPKNIWILIAIATGVLLIACINFTTLAIGRSAGRAKEIGVRKVIGGQKKQLIGQFLAESLLLSFISAGLGLFLAYLLLPLFNQLAGVSLRLSFTEYPEMTGFLAGLIVLVGLLSGSYPALVLSRFKPIETLKNKIRVAGSNFFTKSLVTFQFVLSAGLIIVTIIMLQQISFMRTKDLGFAKENIIMIKTRGVDAKKAYPLFSQALQSEPSIIGIAASEIGLGANEGQMGGRYEYNENKKGVIVYPIDPGYLKVMGMRLITGRNFNPAIASDTINSIIVNESLVKDLLGLTPEQALNKQIKGKGDKAKTIIGVSGDFNFEDLTRTVRPQFFSYPADFNPSVFFVRIRPGDPSKALKVVESAWAGITSEFPLNYTFMDEKFARFYQAEQRWSRIVGWAGGISIFLACLGLFGLAALAAVNRTKEIGIRKVLGATVTNIAGLLSKDFIKLVIIALVIASPLAWYFMNDWLQDYAYRINISWWVFVLAGVMAIGIALLTIGFQAVKAAVANPVKSLRTE
jgi:putative ABC transport system permease protein